MFPHGFLGTRADLLMDLVIVALVAVVPIVLFNWHLARAGRYPLHKTLQVGLAALLAAVVAVFEVNLRLQGGVFVATAASTYAGTPTLNGWIYVHTFFAITTLLVWAALIALLTAIGIATAFIGLIFLMPLVGHATWHAYRALIEPPATT